MRFPAILALTFALAACGGGTPAPAPAPAPGAPVQPQVAAGPAITGTIDSEGPAALAAGAQLALRLLDTTRADAEPTVVAEFKQPVTALPAEFRMPYDEKLIDSNRAYAVDAKVLDGETVTFVSLASAAVLTEGKPDRVSIRVVQALTAAPRDPAAELVKEFTDFEQRLGGLDRFADSRIIGPEGKEVAIGWDGFSDDAGVRMVRETVSDGEGGNRYNRRFAWKDGKLWVAIREQGGTKVRLGWDKDGTLIVKEKNGQADESVAAEADALSKAARDALAIASARAGR
jgi:uncharacterized lipoprotein YbaY